MFELFEFIKNIPSAVIICIAIFFAFFVTILMIMYATSDRKNPL